MGDFSHLSQDGSARMVDITGKAVTTRQALVGGSVEISSACSAALNSSSIREIITTARIAGIQASKQCSSLIPLCHQIALNKVELEISFDSNCRQFSLLAQAASSGTTGVEMEALTAASIAGLTIYDMIKAVDPAATVGPFRLLRKSGGKHGEWSRADD
jgi:cyclic pyranopterin phosphate synthase